MCLSRTEPSRFANKGGFAKTTFTFDHEHNRYRCPGGKYLKQDAVFLKRGKRMMAYSCRAKICAQCSLRQRCLPDKTPYRRISRWEHEEIVDAHRQRMKREGRAYMKKRAALAEHPFGTLKLWCGWTHFLMRGLKKVQAEMDLLMLSYNLMRVINIIGMHKMIEYCKARARQRKKGGSPSHVSGRMPAITFFAYRIVRHKICRMAHLTVYFALHPGGAVLGR